MSTIPTDRLALALAAYAAASQRAEAKSQSLVPVKRNAQGRVVKVEANVVGVKVQPVPPVAPVVPRIDHDAFLAALRAAGTRRNEKGVPVPQGSDVQIADERKAIDAFIGYRAGEPHGLQLDQARREAQRQARAAKGESVGGMTRDEKRAHYASLKGWVAGSESTDSAKGDALAREKLAVEELCAAERDLLKLLETGAGSETVLIAEGRVAVAEAALDAAKARARAALRG